MTALVIAVAVFVGLPALGVGVLFLLRFEAWLKDRRLKRAAADAAIDRFLRRQFAALDDPQEMPAVNDARSENQPDQT